MKALIIGIVVYFILGLCYTINFFHDEYENMVENEGVNVGEFFSANNYSLSCSQSWMSGMRGDFMLDKFGKLIRDIRITRSLLLYDMAKTLDISPAELSAIECGRKPVPNWFIPALEKHYDIGETCAHTLRVLAKNRGD